MPWMFSTPSERPCMRAAVGVELDQVAVGPDACVSAKYASWKRRAVGVAEEAERTRGEGVSADQLADC